MNKQELINQIKEKKSFLCIGLDTDSQKIPKHLLSLEDPVFEFNNILLLDEEIRFLAWIYIYRQ